MRKRVLAILAATVLLFSFAACSKAGTESTTAGMVTTATAPATLTAAETTTEPETTQGPSDARTGAATTAATTKATTKPATQAPSTTSAVKAFIKTELAKFDGKSGRDAYVAYNGVVYNVTGDVWQNGEHHGLKAGNDITPDINSCIIHKLSSGFFENVWARKNYVQVGTYTG